MARAAYELHLARRFYERPESLEQQTYRERPDPDDASSRPVPLPERQGEFHERVTVLGDHAELLRRLGLVIDLVVADVDRLGRARWLQGVVEVDGATSKRTRVRCQRTSDGALVTVPGTSDWHDGALALGDDERFAVVDVDADGSALKTDRFLWSIPRIKHVEEDGNEIDAANPALRSPGLTVARTGQGATSKERVSTQNGYDATFRTSDELTHELAAEDVTRGMRVEVWDDHSGDLALAAHPPHAVHRRPRPGDRRSRQRRLHPGHLCHHHTRRRRHQARLRARGDVRLGGLESVGAAAGQADPPGDAGRVRRDAG